MIKIIVYSTYKIMIEVARGVQVKKLSHAGHDRYYFIATPNKVKGKAIKKLTLYYKNKLG